MAPPPDSFYLWTAGRCPSPLTTVDECTAAAATLPLGSDAALRLTTTDSSWRPRFCSLYFNDHYSYHELTFNTHEVGGDCSSYRTCLCREPPPSPYESKLVLDLSYGADAINMTLAYSAANVSLESPAVTVKGTLATSWTSGPPAELSGTYTDAWFADEAQHMSVGGISRRGEARIALTHAFADAEQRAEFRAWLDPSPLTYLSKDLWGWCGSAHLDPSTFMPTVHPQINASSYLLGDTCELASNWVPKGGALLESSGLEPMELQLSLETPFFEYLSPATDPPFYRDSWQPRMLSVRPNSLQVSGTYGNGSFVSTTTYALSSPCECKESWEMPSFFALSETHGQSCSGQQSGCSTCLADGDETFLLARFCEVKQPGCLTSGLPTVTVPSACANNDYCTSEWGYSQNYYAADGMCDDDGYPCARGTDVTGERVQRATQSAPPSLFSPSTQSLSHAFSTFAQTAEIVQQAARKHIKFRGSIDRVSQCAPSARHRRRPQRRSFPSPLSWSAAGRKGQLTST